jgi:hypothetical protein
LGIKGTDFDILALPVHDDIDNDKIFCLQQCLIKLLIVLTIAGKQVEKNKT